MDATIGVASPGDRAAVADLLRSCGLPDQDVTAELLRDFLVARRGGELAGVVGLEPLGRDGLLRSLAVGPAFRGRGLGLALTRALEAHARRLGVERLFLLTTTVQAFFAAHGYRPVPRDGLPLAVQGTSEFRTLCPSTAVCMEKVLDLGDRSGL
jgi:amino-acid N-acetyltransferase